VIVLREVDQSFADTYSTGVSMQNLLPRTDRRILTVTAGVVSTVLALLINIGEYAGFLALIGSVFVPLFGVLAADYFGHRRRLDLSVRAPSRPAMLVAWLAGLVAYQLINPGQLGAWSRMWTGVANALHFTPQPWMSASLFSFLVAALLAWLFGFRKNAG
jgi:purine-cytosine permease-like protein